MAKANSIASEKKEKSAKILTTEFRLQAPGAKKVCLAGDFNEWDETEFRIRKYKGGMFIKKLALESGRYEYKFLVDGTWTIDPENPVTQSNEFGSENSVIVVNNR